MTLEKILTTEMDKRNHAMLQNLYKEKETSSFSKENKIKLIFSCQDQIKIENFAVYNS